MTFQRSLLPDATLPRVPLVMRLVALAASCFVTVAIVTALAGYGLPSDEGGSLVARALPKAVK